MSDKQNHDALAASTLSIAFDDGEEQLVPGGEVDTTVRPAPVAVQKRWMDRLEQTERVLTAEPVNEAALARFRAEWQPLLDRLRAALRPRTDDQP